MHVGVLWGCSVPWGGVIFCYLSTPTVLNTPTVLMISSHGTQITKDGIPHMHHDIPTVLHTHVYRVRIAEQGIQ